MTAALSNHLAKAGFVPEPKDGDIRFSPYMQTDRHPTRVTVERLEYRDCYSRKIWRALGTYDSEASARKAMAKAEG